MDSNKLACSQIITNGYLVEAKTMQLALDLKQAAYDKLMPLKDFKLKYVKKEHIESIVRPLTKILDNVFTREECGRFIEILCLEVALNSLRSSFFDKKLYGLNYISEMVDMVRRGEDSSLESTVMVTGGEGVYRGLGPTARWVTRAYLVQWIQSNNVLETVFGNAAHPQLIRRAGDLIRLLARQNELTEQHLDLILSRAKDCHETQAASVLTVLTESAGQLSLQHQQHIHEFISQTPVQSYTVPTLRFIYDLSRFAQDVELKLRFADLLWNTVLLQGHLEVSLESMRLLEEIIRHQSYMHSHRASWVDRILSAINQGQSVPFCYRLLEAVQVALPRDIESLRAESLSSQPGEEAIILDTFFKELERFKPRLQAVVQRAIEELPPPIDYNNLPILDFTLVDQLRYRLHFLQFLLTHAPQVSNFGQRHLDKIFDCFILQPTTPVEVNECFLWLLTSPPIVIDLVSSAFSSLVRKINFEKLTTNGLKFIQRFFCETNSRQQKMQMRYSNNELDFELQTIELDSYDLLWDVLGSVPTELVRDSVDFVTKFQYKLAPHLNDTSIQLKLREEFVERCISFIEPALQSNILSEIEERKVERSLSLLLMQCEGERGNKSDSHGARTRGKPLILYVENHMNDSVGDGNGDKSKKNFKLELHGNETVGGVRKKVAETLGLSGDNIQIFLEYEVLEKDEKRLNELDFQSSQTIVVRSTVRIPAEKMTQLRGRNSAPAASPSPAKVEIPPDAKEKAQQLMEIYSLGYSVAMFALKRAGWDLPNAASSLFDDRAQLMQLAAESNEFREGQDDKEEERPDEGEEGDPRTRVSTILCNREAYLDQLFYLLNSKSEAICRKAWSLLMLLPTNKSLLQELQTLSDLRTGTADWARLFDKGSYFKLLYSLQVVDSIIFPLEDSYDSEGKRAVWCKAFLVLGGLEMLSDILLSYPAQNYATLPSEQKSGIAIVTKLFHFFLHSLLIEERIPSLMLSGNTPLERPSSLLEEPSSLNLRGSNGGIAALEDIVPSSPSLNRVSRMVHKISQEVSTRQLDEIKYDSLLCKLLQVVSAATSTPDRDDDTLAYAMRIIVLCILYQTDSLLPQFYNFPGLDEVLVSGLLRCPISFIRSEVAEGVYRLCNKVINRAAEYEVPHPYFLRLLLNNFPDHLSTDSSVWTRTAQYFNLLNKLISDSYNPLYSLLPRSPTELLHLFIKCIKENPTVESIANGVDETLVGLLTGNNSSFHNHPFVVYSRFSHNLAVTATLLKKEPQLRSSTEFNFLDLVDEVYSRCLFVQNTSSRVQPKCTVTRSRAAAFSLLVELSRDSTQSVARL
jgi:hypothetical protein